MKYIYFGCISTFIVDLELNTVNINEINDTEELELALNKLKNIGVDGLMIDLWWGRVNR